MWCFAVYVSTLYKLWALVITGTSNLEVVFSSLVLSVLIHLILLFQSLTLGDRIDSPHPSIPGYYQPVIHPFVSPDLNPPADQVPHVQGAQVPAAAVHDPGPGAVHERNGNQNAEAVQGTEGQAAV